MNPPEKSPGTSPAKSPERSPGRSWKTRALIAAGTATAVTVTALAAVSVGTPAGATDRAAADRAAADRARGPRPAPRVLPFATKLGPPKARITKRPGKVQVKAFVDACDHGYGTIDQCVPVTFPKLARGTTKCGWLLARGFGPLAVHGKDKHRLDSDRDGIACGPGDKK